MGVVFHSEQSIFILRVIPQCHQAFNWIYVSTPVNHDLMIVAWKLSCWRFNMTGFGRPLEGSVISSPAGRHVLILTYFKVPGSWNGNTMLILPLQFVVVIVRFSSEMIQLEQIDYSGNHSLLMPTSKNVFIIGWSWTQLAHWSNSKIGHGSWYSVSGFVEDKSGFSAILVIRR